MTVRGSAGACSTSYSTRSIGPAIRSRLDDLVREAVSSGSGAISVRDVGALLTETSSATPTRMAVQAEALQPKGFVRLLIEYHAFGLSQARTSLRVSLGSSILGGLVLAFGVALAFLRTDGQQTASIVTSLSGVTTSAIGILFHRQSAQALKHMESQTQGLRTDMKAERDQLLSIELLKQVEDPLLRSQLQAGLILKLTGSTLANGDSAPRGSTTNGLDPQQ